MDDIYDDNMLGFMLRYDYHDRCMLGLLDEHDKCMLGFVYMCGWVSYCFIDRLVCVLG